jgi:drug/metabolite transporter (DMT)-like permease
MSAATKPWVGMYLVAGLIWGGSFLFVEYALTALSPIGVAFWRTLFGALAMLVAIAIYGSKLPKSFEVWKRLTIAGLLMSSVPFSLFAYAQQHVSSALAGIINSITPIATVIVVLIAFRTEKVKAHVLWGLLIGLIGVLVVLGVWEGFGSNEPLAIIAMLVAVTCYGIGTPYVRNQIAPLNLPTEVSVFGQIGTAAVTLLPIYFFEESLFIGSISIEAVLSVIAIGALGSGVAYLLYYKVLSTVGSALASSVTYITPIIAVILGVLILREDLHWYEPVGGLVVILGAAISQGSILKFFSKERSGRASGN